jgi:hypothetical protein
MQNIQEVSLGFAEFVSQLIQETFDAILSSQNYQLERYAELQGRIDLPNANYRQVYNVGSRVPDRIQQFFGFSLTLGMPVDPILNDFLVENFDDISLFIDATNGFTNEGLIAVEDFFTDLIINEEKTMLNALINQSDVSRLVIDAGEITAKLELSSLFMDDTPPPPPDGGDGTVATLESTDTKTTDINSLDDSSLFDKDAEAINPDSLKDPLLLDQDAGTIDPNQLESTATNTTTLNTGNIDQLRLPTYNNSLTVYKFQNIDTGRDTLLVDRNQFDQVNSSNVLIPNVRLSAQPTKLTTNSNLFAEVKISFKTV